MMKPGVLFLALAVAACQFKLHLSEIFVGSGVANISSCPVAYLGRPYDKIKVSFSDSMFTICSVEGRLECLKVVDSQGYRILVDVLFEETKPGSFLHQILHNINSSSPCLVKVELQDKTNSTYLQILTYNFGTQGAQMFNATSLFNMTYLNFTVATVSSIPLVRRSLKASKVKDGVVFDVSGCRASDMILPSGMSKYIEETCVNISCSPSAELSVDNTCGPAEVCRGNTGCAPRLNMCVVTRSTVIDFFNRVHSITNRCTYSLIKPQGGSDFQLLAGFQERRQQNVVFLDHLILQLEEPDVVVYLEQGGLVEVNNEALDLNTTAQLVHGVELSKDQTVVTANIPFANITIYFDGNTVHVAGNPSAVEGLCGNPGNSSQNTTLGAETSSFYSISGCEGEFTETVIDKIDCNATTEHCSLLKQAPFYIYNLVTDPEPYITACTNTLCNYPMVDDLGCQFMEAYAKSCSLQLGKKLTDWRPAVNCPDVPETN